MNYLTQKWEHGHKILSNRPMLPSFFSSLVHLSIHQFISEPMNKLFPRITFHASRTYFKISIFRVAEKSGVCRL